VPAAGFCEAISLAAREHLLLMTFAPALNRGVCLEVQAGPRSRCQASRSIATVTIIARAARAMTRRPGCISACRRRAIGYSSDAQSVLRAPRGSPCDAW
jgi:hypothetical protein